MTEDTQTVTLDGESDDAPSPRGQRGRYHGLLIFLRDIVFILLAALVISFVIKTFFIRSFYIPSESMENTLDPNDRVIVSLLTPGLTPLKRGDVVVFEDPGGWLDDTELQKQPDNWLNDALAFVGLAAPDDNDHLIKRVIGLPGDHVMCCNTLGQLEINGVPVKEPYVNLADHDQADPFQFSVTVPKGDLFVLGDNRYESADSAYHEQNHDVSPFVPMSDVTGRAMVISWPINRWKYLDDYPLIFQDVVDKGSK